MFIDSTIPLLHSLWLLLPPSHTTAGAGLFGIGVAGTVLADFLYSYRMYLEYTFFNLYVELKSAIHLYLQFIDNYFHWLLTVKIVFLYLHPPRRHDLKRTNTHAGRPNFGYLDSTRLPVPVGMVVMVHYIGRQVCYGYYHLSARDAAGDGTEDMLEKQLSERPSSTTLLKNHSYHSRTPIMCETCRD